MSSALTTFECDTSRSYSHTFRTFFLFGIRFNENVFRKELISLGISPNASYTMKEWSAIRRKISKRSPRRFSRKFIDMQFEQLNQYRRRVRKIQKCQFMGESIENDPNFEFEGKHVHIEDSPVNNTSYLVYSSCTTESG